MADKTANIPGTTTCLDNRCPTVVVPAKQIVVGGTMGTVTRYTSDQRVIVGIENGINGPRSNCCDIAANGSYNAIGIAGPGSFIVIGIFTGAGITKVEISRMAKPRRTDRSTVSQCASGA